MHIFGDIIWTQNTEAINKCKYKKEDIKGTLQNTIEIIYQSINRGEIQTNT